MPRPISAQTRNEMNMKSKATRNLTRTDDVVEKLRLLCLQRGATGIIGLGRLFRIIDDNQSGDLGRDEFLKAIEESGYADHLSEQDIEHLFERFDADNSGAISYEEFLRTLRPPMNAARREIVERAFDKLDRTGDGQITYDDLKNVYSVRVHPEFQNGTKTEQEIFKKFLSVFEQNGAIDGIVTRDEFMDYYSGVSASIDEDGYFDLVIRNAYKL